MSSGGSIIRVRLLWDDRELGTAEVPAAVFDLEHRRNVIIAIAPHLDTEIGVQLVKARGNRPFNEATRLEVRLEVINGAT